VKYTVEKGNGNEDSKTQECKEEKLKIKILT
jgi:hypothetical protein